MLSTWELFREELLRNISPNESEIKVQFQFLLENKMCDIETYENIVHVRLMASFESGINRYLHPPIELLQGNLKAEALHLGTIVEALLGILLKTIEAKRNQIILEKRPTFYQLSSLVKKHTDNDRNLIIKIDELRHERNKIHIGAIRITNMNELSHEEYKVIEYRRKLDFLLCEMKRIINI